MASDLSAPPVLSTPAEYTFIDDPTLSSTIAQTKQTKRSDDELYEVYEIARTAADIQQNGWRHIALQFPDAMLPDAPWIVNALRKELRSVAAHLQGDGEENEEKPAESQRLYILADTSYSACCVDEIAAEHANAEGVVHYGRACLSPTSRIPVIHIFTKQKLDYYTITESFEKEFQDKTDKVVVMADVMFQDHVLPICELLRERGYTTIIATEIVRDPTGPIPNRNIIFSATPSEDEIVHNLNEYHLFHISTPPTSLLMTLSSRLASLRIYSTPSSPYITDSTPLDPSATQSLLRRRYGLVIRLATASIIGILVNTLSVKNYMSTISTLKSQIAAAGKKSYTIVVGKLNAAKLANFAEIDGWVVVGCWESGLVEQEGLWKPVVTPFELGLALQGEESRVWTGEWWGGIEGVGTSWAEERSAESIAKQSQVEEDSAAAPDLYDIEGGVDDEESEPPEFDLRTGKLVSNSRPMRMAIRSVPRSGAETNDVLSSLNQTTASSAAIVRRAAGDVALVNGVASPGAEFLRSQRTWQGLGTEFGTEDDEDSTVVREGRSGVARGYTVGTDETRT
ncbi:diphthamide biosynthesis protein [Hypoxylon fragiforme]|uniref:diphthamide biosynthesis protein n=1 Tax=Hypoxylon fragiforme TaxID=63214 RepID=UPI0020C64FC7|nr:diphthamide biosynthesis protein [Hypoxylon fragiforme]KAI2604107.1 diphthamide biosynthesis protein [Hypoxylon fragiforme]